MKLHQRIAANIEAQRAAQGLSLTDLARKSGVSRGYIYLLTKAENSPTIEVLEKIARAFDMPLLALLQKANAVRPDDLTDDEYRLLSRYRSRDIAGVLRMVADLAEVDAQAADD